MTVETLMTRDVACCSPEDTLNRAAQLMWECDCGSIPVVEDDRVVGMITDRDCCMATYTKGLRLDDIRIGEVMARDVKTCSPSDNLERVEDEMRRHQVRRMPVVNDGRIVGILSMNDIALASERGQANPDDVASTLAGVCRHRGQPQPLAAE